MANANPSGNYIINFAANLAGSTITLSYDGPDAGTLPDVLTIGSNVTIVGLGANQLSISGNNQIGVFQLNAGYAATISDLTIKSGNQGTGGGISSSGNLTLNRVAIENNTASVGAGIYATGGSLSITASTIANNTASFIGAGIFASVTTSIVDSTISTNSVGSGSGGGLYAANNNVTLVNSTVTQNTGNGGGIYIVSGAQIVLKNTIVAGNVLSGTTANNISGTVNTGSSSHNLVGSGGSGGLVNGTNGNIVQTSGQMRGWRRLVITAAARGRMHYCRQARRSTRGIRRTCRAG